MQCREINDMMMKYFDGNISELELEMIAKHNEKCTDCAVEFQALKDAIFTLEELPDIEVPAGFEARVMDGIKTQGTYSMNPRTLAHWLIAVLGLIVFAWNIMSFAVLPWIKESGVLIMAQNLIIYALNFGSDILKNVLMVLSVLLGKIIIFRNILLRDYINIVVAIVLAFMGINLLMISRLKLRED